VIRRALPTRVRQLGENEVEIRMMTSGLGRDGHIIEPSGAMLGNYRRNPIQLWQHDPSCPVGRNEDLRVDGNSIVARSVFVPSGISAKADEVRGLVKMGVINAVSIGFDIIESEPLDPKRPRAGQHITVWELIECSYVSVPADPEAVVVSRAHHLRRSQEGALREKLAGHIDEASRHLHDAVTAHARGHARDIERAHTHLRRCLTAAQRCMRNLAEAAAQQDIDASHTIQGAGGGIATAIDAGTSPPRSSLTYVPGESAAGLVARLQQADIAQRLRHFRAGAAGLGGGLTFQERQAEAAARRRAPWCDPRAA
jgi:HK97 family phage prohead protease